MVFKDLPLSDYGDNMQVESVHKGASQDNSLTPDIEFTSGHRCVDNGSGDYNLICPKGGKQFLPYMLARTLSAHNVCGLCGEAIGDESD